MEERKRSSAAARRSDGTPASPPASHSQLIAMQWRTERADLPLDNFLLAIYLMRLGTLVDRAFDQHCQQTYGIGGGDMRVMLALRRGGPPYARRPTDLFRALLVTSGAITKKVDRLVAAGYAERLPDPGHGGGFLVHLTRRGLHVVNQASEHLAHQSVVAPALAKFTPQEQRQGADFVLRVLSHLESTVEDLDAPPPAQTARKSARRKGGAT